MVAIRSSFTCCQWHFQKNRGRGHVYPLTCLPPPPPLKIPSHHAPQPYLLMPQIIHPSPEHLLLSTDPAEVSSLGFMQEVRKALHNSKQKKGQEPPLPQGRCSSPLCWFREEDTVEEGAMRTGHDGTFPMLQAWFYVLQFRIFESCQLLDP